MQVPKALWLLGAAVLVAGCATTATAFRTTWKNPEARPLTLDGQKIVVLLLRADDATRRAGEDTVAAQITARGAQGVAAWSILPQADLQDEAKARAALAKAGAAGVVVMELVPDDRRIRPFDFRGSMSSPSYSSFWGHYQHVWGGGRSGSPGGSSGAWVETLVYTLQPDALVWAGRSRTVNAGGAAGLFTEVSNAVADEVERAGLLKRQPK